MKRKFAIIADDISGANDTGVQFKQFGFKTAIFLKAEEAKNLASQADILIIDTESREDPPRTAYKKVREAARVLKELGINTVYKKIDTAQRGNIAVELDAIMDEMEIPLAFLIPAWPATGRITVGGYQLLNQIPLEKTEYALEPVRPIKESHVPTMIAKDSSHRVGQIELSKILRGERVLRREIKNRQKQGKEILVMDATSASDFRTIAKAIASLSMPLILCGSYQFAKELLSVLYLDKAISKPVVMINGSYNPVTLRQIEQVERALDTFIIELKIDQILKAAKVEMKRILKEAEEALDRGEDVIITSVTSKAPMVQTQDLRSKIVDFLGEVAKKLIEGEEISGLIVSGGDTAFHVCKALGASKLEIKEEIYPAIVLAKIKGGLNDGLRIVTKGGAVGSPDSLIETMRYLKLKSLSLPPS